MPESMALAFGQGGAPIDLDLSAYGRLKYLYPIVS